MHTHHLILTATAVVALSLSNISLAEDPAPKTMDQETADAIRARTLDAAGGTREPISPADDAFKKQKVDEATAADARYHANRTEANRVARDKAEAEAGAVIRDVNGLPPRLEAQRMETGGAK